MKKTKDTKIDEQQEEIMKFLSAKLNQKGKYTLLGFKNMVGLMSIIFIKQELEKRTSHFEMQEIKTGLKGYHGNKVSLCIDSRVELFQDFLWMIHHFAL